jgi:putative membrane protein
MMHGFGFGFGPWGWVIMILFWGLVILGVFWLIRSILSGWANYSPHRSDTGPNAREILDRRYAHGEIDRKQYEVIKKDLAGDG